MSDPVTLMLGDCIERMKELPDASVDAVVTDPPYNLGFMSKAWDFNHQHEPWAREAFRVAKPGAFLLAFGGTRTFHRLASAIEDAGWEIRDCLVWAYASGFPKSLDVSKAIDRAAGAEREVVGTSRGVSVEDDQGFGGIARGGVGIVQTAVDLPVTAPATDEAKRWQGWGTALKPAWEPIVMARKPLRGTVAQNVQEWGTGALNIEATRIGYAPDDAAEVAAKQSKNPTGHAGLYGVPGVATFTPSGRWPPNLLLTDPIFDGDTPGVVGGGEGGGGFGVRGRGGDVYGGGNGYTTDMPETGQTVGYGDSGTYSRFFLIPKSSRSDREPLLRGQLEIDGDRSGSSGRTFKDGEWVETHSEPRKRANSHPTVKPIELMRHLVRLVTPPGGTILDCFGGSGTTAIAALEEGFRCILIEKEPEYMKIAEARLNGRQVGLGLDMGAAL